MALQPSGRQRRPSARIAVARASPSSLRMAGDADEHERDRAPDPHAGRPGRARCGGVEHAWGRLAAVAEPTRRGSLPSARDTDWPLFLHLVGAFLFVGGSSPLRYPASRRYVASVRPSSRCCSARCGRSSRSSPAAFVLTVAAGFWRSRDWGSTTAPRGSRRPSRPCSGSWWSGPSRDARIAAHASSRSGWRRTATEAPTS